tara:strand:+ start:383 stop:895 length:513 start_codon:yes stop_codon:yes gene_type:complete
VIDIHAKFDNGWWHGSYNGASGYFPGGYVEEIADDGTANESESPAPADSAGTSSPLQESAHDSPVVSVGDVPPPPPPAPLPTKPTPSSTASTTSKKEAAEPAAGGRSDMLAQIRGGAALKHVEKKELNNLNAKQRTGLVGVMAQAMADRRHAMHESVDQEEGDWDEWVCR